MKRLVQIFLLSLIIFICIYFYKNYLKKETKTKNNVNDETLIIDNNTDQKNQNNLIENLSYNVKFFGNKRYMINAQKSEILNQDNSEIVKMDFVIAEYVDEEKSPITIKSNQATYNSLSYNSRFTNNVKITYLNHLIEAENVYIDFKNNIILIKDNVEYKGPLVSMKSDGIKIDLTTKNISIFMDKKFESITLESKK
jgi:lipopolysaccharide export system protein LptC